MELFSSRFARLALAALAFAVTATEASSARAECAVSSLNGKLDAGAGVAKAGPFAATDGAFQLGATLSAPLGCDWGLLQAGPNPAAGFVGAVDEVRIYHRALPATEIQTQATVP